jgi:hypothetical protein
MGPKAKKLVADEVYAATNLLYQLAAIVADYAPLTGAEILLRILAERQGQFEITVVPYDIREHTTEISISMPLSLLGEEYPTIGKKVAALREKGWFNIWIHGEGILFERLSFELLWTTIEVNSVTTKLTNRGKKSMTSTYEEQVRWIVNDY